MQVLVLIVFSVAKDHGMDKPMGTAEVARRMGTGVQNVHEFIKRGELKAFNFSCGTRSRLKVYESDFQAFLARRSVGGQPATVRRRRKTNEAVPQYV